MFRELGEGGTGLRRIIRQTGNAHRVFHAAKLAGRMTMTIAKRRKRTDYERCVFWRMSAMK